ncbi:MAG: Hpt domain-containing protein [Rhodocyclales bacterium]|nr:Hpt domain-containing protein [Rhodocyclales bacterium]
MHATHPDRSDPNAGPAAVDRKVLDQYREIDPSGGLGLALRILRIYIDSSGETWRGIGQAIAGRDGEALRLAAHSLKSSTASVGALPLANLFRELEALAKSAHMDEAEILFASMQGEYARVLAALHEILAEAT